MTRVFKKCKEPKTFTHYCDAANKNCKRKATDLFNSQQKPCTFLDEDKENFAQTVKETNPGLFSSYNDAENCINNNSMINERQTHW